MSVQKITKAVYRCTCELCGAVWDTKDFRIPPRCNGCHRYTWNNVDRRRQEFRDTKPKKGSKS
jgi:hypothetical protein